MPRAHAALSPVQAASDVHQAADVGGHHHVGAAALDGVELRVQHRRRERAQLDGEEAAEPAAGLRIRQVGAPRARCRAQQAARLLAKAEAAQSVARRVIRDCRAGLRRGRSEAEDVDEKLGELVRPPRQFHRLLAVLRVAGEQGRVMVDDHVGAGTRRHDHRVRHAGQRVDRGAGHRGGVRGEPRVVGGLPAAGLVGRHVDLDASAFERLDGGVTDGREEPVDQTGGKQLDASRPRRHGGCVTSHGDTGSATARRDPASARPSAASRDRAASRAPAARGRPVRCG